MLVPGMLQEGRSDLRSQLLRLHIFPRMQGEGDERGREEERHEFSP